MRALVVGNGFLGSEIAGRLSRLMDTTVASRGGPRVAGGPSWTHLDATDPGQCRRLLADLRPDLLVLVHGPSDVTWCEAHPDAALDAHATAARNLSQAAPSCRTLLISTDNVFAGEAPRHDEHAVPSPRNAYGRAKRAAERIVLERHGDAVVLRVSLVYGQEEERPGGWLNFFAACARRLRRGEPVEAPADHWNTPVLLDDAAEVACALATGEDLPRLVHLGGPDRVSRAAWARLIAAALGDDQDLVVPVPRAGSRYACRPAHACLTSVHLGHLPATRGIRIRGVAEGARLLAQRAETSPTPPQTTRRRQRERREEPP